MSVSQAGKEEKNQNIPCQEGLTLSPPYLCFAVALQQYHQLKHNLLP